MEKAEVIAALYEGYTRQDQAFGYCRAFGAMMAEIPGGLTKMEEFLAFDLVREIKKSPFFEIANRPKEEFHEEYLKKLELFECPTTSIRF